MFETFSKPTVVSIGKFDTLHLGHQRLISELKKMATAGEALTLVTFPLGTEKLLTTADRQWLAMQLGVGQVVELPFSKEILGLTAEDFVRRLLVEEMQMKAITVGYDFRFGRERRGDAKLLQEQGRKYGFAVRVIEAECMDGQIITSTGIRADLVEGRLDMANRKLGYPYFVSGTVVSDRKLGRTIGFPTANVVPEPGKLLPPFGVYVSTVLMGGRYYRGITNIGTKPTITAQNPVSVETYLFDFHEDCYGQEQKVFLLDYMRPEIKLAGMEELKACIETDRKQALKYFAHHQFEETKIGGPYGRIIK